MRDTRLTLYADAGKSPRPVGKCRFQKFDTIFHAALPGTPIILTNAPAWIAAAGGWCVNINGTWHHESRYVSTDERADYKPVPPSHWELDMSKFKNGMRI